MKLILTKEEAIDSAISYLKFDGTLLRDRKYEAEITEYNSEEFLTITEVPEPDDTETKAEDEAISLADIDFDNVVDSSEAE